MAHAAHFKVRVFSKIGRLSPLYTLKTSPLVYMSSGALSH